MFDTKEARQRAEVMRAMDDGPVMTRAAGLIDDLIAELEALRTPVKAPVAITDAMVEEATIAGFVAATGGTLENFAMLSGRGRENLRASTRAVLGYAASIGVTDAAPVAKASRPFRPTADMMRSVMVGACAAANFTEAQTIERLAAHAAALEVELRRVAPGHVPGDAVAPAGKCAAERSPARG